MPETAETTLVCLEELPLPPGLGADTPGFWGFGLGRIDPGEIIAWIFKLDPGASLPRGYLDSVRQRHLQWSALSDLPGETIVRLDESGPGEVVFASFEPDGESFPGFLARVPVLHDRVAWRLCLEILSWLKALIPVPRILSNVDPSDFLVYARNGIVPSIAFCPVFSLVREEAPLSDYRIARLWSERFAVLHSFIKGGRKGSPLKGSPGYNKAFRTLFKHFDIGKDRSLAERFDEVAAIFQAEWEASTRGEKGAESPLARRSFPMGPLARLLRERAVHAEPSRFPGATEPWGEHDGEVPVFSAFRMDRLVVEPPADRIGHLLPPESWFGISLIDRLNRRLSHPFLKAHHHCLRIRSVYCDESFTLLVGDPSEGIPLPSLLAAGEGLVTGDLLLILGKFHRALAQFESAGFDAELLSPWQIELHLEAGVIHPGWKSLLSTEVSAWPAWEVIVRIERPAECFLPGETTSAWRGVQEHLHGKFFPALVAWMLDWKRFQWAARAGTLKGEPVSWDERLLPLFEAARDHLDPTQGAQREKFLALLEEGLMLD
jgi:hypothetical protein